jgi:hypothetical protein
MIIISSKMFAQSTVEISELSVTWNTKLTIFPKLKRKKNKENLWNRRLRADINILFSNTEMTIFAEQKNEIQK